MKVKFFKDDFNGRFTWSWVDGEYVTEDSVEIEHYIALGIRHEEVKPVEVVKEKTPRKKRQTKKAD